MNSTDALLDPSSSKDILNQETTVGVNSEVGNQELYSRTGDGHENVIVSEPVDENGIGSADLTSMPLSEPVEAIHDTTQPSATVLISKEEVDLLSEDVDDSLPGSPGAKAEDVHNKHESIATDCAKGDPGCEDEILETIDEVKDGDGNSSDVFESLKQQLEDLSDISDDELILEGFSQHTTATEPSRDLVDLSNSNQPNEIKETEVQHAKVADEELEDEDNNVLDPAPTAVEATAEIKPCDATIDELKTELDTEKATLGDAVSFELSEPGTPPSDLETVDSVHNSDEELCEPEQNIENIDANLSAPVNMSCEAPLEKCSSPVEDKTTTSDTTQAKSESNELDTGLDLIDSRRESLDSCNLENALAEFLDNEEIEEETKLDSIVEVAKSLENKSNVSVAESTDNNVSKEGNDSDVVQEANILPSDEPAANVSLTLDPPDKGQHSEEASASSAEQNTCITDNECANISFETNKTNTEDNDSHISEDVLYTKPVFLQDNEDSNNVGNEKEQEVTTPVISQLDTKDGDISVFNDLEGEAVTKETNITPDEEEHVNENSKVQSEPEKESEAVTKEMNITSDKEEHFDESRKVQNEPERNLFKVFPEMLSSEGKDTQQGLPEEKTPASSPQIKQKEHLEDSVVQKTDVQDSSNKLVKSQTDKSKTKANSHDNIDSLKKTKATSRSNRKPIFKSGKGKKKSSANQDSSVPSVSCEKYDSSKNEETILEKAKLKYPCLKELRISLDVEELKAVRVTEEKPSRTIGTNLIAKSASSKSKKSSSKRKSKGSKLSKDINTELTQSADSCDQKNSNSCQSDGDNFKPLKKRSRHTLDEEKKGLLNHVTESRNTSKGNFTTMFNDPCKSNPDSVNDTTNVPLLIGSDEKGQGSDENKLSENMDGKQKSDTKSKSPKKSRSRSSSKKSTERKSKISSTSNTELLPTTEQMDLKKSSGSKFKIPASSNTESVSTIEKMDLPLKKSGGSKSKISSSNTESVSTTEKMDLKKSSKCKIPASSNTESISTTEKMDLPLKKSSTNKSKISSSNTESVSTTEKMDLPLKKSSTNKSKISSTSSTKVVSTTENMCCPSVEVAILYDHQKVEAESETQTDKVAVDCAELVKPDRKHAIVKKYPERSCKLRQTVEHRTMSPPREEAKEVTKNPLTIVSEKVEKKTKVKSSKDVSVDADGKVIVPLKKKRKRKVKPWSWGNEKKRKPKPKLTVLPVADTEVATVDTVVPCGVQMPLESAESTSTETHGSNDAAEVLPIENSQIKDTTDCHSCVQDESVETMQAGASNVADATKQHSKKSKKRSKSSKRRTSKKSLAAPESQNPEQLNPPINNVNEQRIEHVENEMQDEHYPTVSPDSGIQSLAGSPAGNESPNSIILANVEHVAAYTTSSSTKPSTADLSLCVTASSSTHIPVTSVGLASGVLCATASCSVGSYSMTTSLKSSTETSTVFSTASPLSSVTVSPAVKCANRPKVATSSSHSSVSSTDRTHHSSSAMSATQSQCNQAKDSNLPNTAVSPSKKKNRSKFLHLHKASTLLQKGRLPTEEEKVQRLEDKFDYLSKVGAKIVCDNKTEGLSAEAEMDLHTQKSKPSETVVCDHVQIDQSEESDTLNMPRPSEKPISNVVPKQTVQKDSKKRSKSSEKKSKKQTHSKETPDRSLNKKVKETIDTLHSTEHTETLGSSLLTKENVEKKSHKKSKVSDGSLDNLPQPTETKQPSEHTAAKKSECSDDSTVNSSKPVETVETSIISKESDEKKAHKKCTKQPEESSLKITPEPLVEIPEPLEAKHKSVKKKHKKSKHTEEEIETKATKEPKAVESVETSVPHEDKPEPVKKINKKLARLIEESLVNYHKPRQPKETIEKERQDRSKHSKRELSEHLPKSREHVETTSHSKEVLKKKTSKSRQSEDGADKLHNHIDSGETSSPPKLTSEKKSHKKTKHSKDHPADILPKSHEEAASLTSKTNVSNWLQERFNDSGKVTDVKVPEALVEDQVEAVMPVASEDKDTPEWLCDDTRNNVELDGQSKSSKRRRSKSSGRKRKRKRSHSCNNEEISKRTTNDELVDFEVKESKSSGQMQPIEAHDTPDDKIPTSDSSFSSVASDHISQSITSIVNSLEPLKGSDIASKVVVSTESISTAMEVKEQPRKPKKHKTKSKNIFENIVPDTNESHTVNCDVSDVDFHLDEDVQKATLDASNSRNLTLPKPTCVEKGKSYADSTKTDHTVMDMSDIDSAMVDKREPREDLKEPLMTGSKSTNKPVTLFTDVINDSKIDVRRQTSQESLFVRSPLLGKSKKKFIPFNQKSNKSLFSNVINKLKGRPRLSPLKVRTDIVIKRGRGRPKGSKNKIQSNIINKIKRGRGRPKGALNKVKKTPKEKLSKSGASSGKVAGSSVCSPMSPIMMLWRDSQLMSDGEEKKKKRKKKNARPPGRPRKNPLPVEAATTSDSVEKEAKHQHKHSQQFSPERQIPDITHIRPLLSRQDEPVESVEPETDLFNFDAVGISPGLIRDRLSSSSKMKKKRKKELLRLGSKVRHASDASDGIIFPSRLDNGPDLECANEFGSREPAQSVSSFDSDASGSNIFGKTSVIQQWMEMNKHKRKKNKKKIYYRSKHKNIIDPVYIAEVDYITDFFPGLSISPRGETYLKVRPGEVPRPSIFQITRIDVKKKKKEKLLVFEKAKPLKPKTDDIFSKDKMKLARRISILSESFLDVTDRNGQKTCNLPPKKRHKLFISSEDGGHDGKQEKRKPGRPRKQTATNVSNVPQELPFGELRRKKDNFKMGKECSDSMASFASVALTGGSSTAFSPTRSDTSTSEVISPTSLTSPPTLISAIRDTPTREHSDVCRSILQDDDHDMPPILSEKMPTSTTPRARGTSLTGNVSSDDEHVARDVDDDVTGGPCDIESEFVDHGVNVDNQYGADNAEPACVETESKLSSLSATRKGVKRKHRRTNKLKFSTTKKHKYRAPVLEDVITESPVRSTVCSESQPLPVIHRDKRFTDEQQFIDDEDQLLTLLKPKPLKRRTSAESQSSEASIVKKQMSFQKKRFQKCGLYSNSFKDEGSEKEKDLNMVKSGFMFEMPLHFGNHLMRSQDDFQLPYDVWWLNFNDMLPKKGDGHQYRRIRSNVYVDTKPTCRYEAHSCNCKLPANPEDKACGEDCLNRLIYTECSTDLCPCGDRCSNNGIQKRHFAPGLQKFLTKDRGFGVRTTKPIKAGDLITEYCGEVVSEQEFRRRMTEEYSLEWHHYCLNLDSGTVIDGYRMGNVARFVNHSCQPNCEMQKWNATGIYHMCLFALKDIEPGTELAYDYNFQYFNHDAKQMCRCGSQECRGIIGGRKENQNTGSKHGSDKLHGKQKGRHQKDKRKSKHKADRHGDKDKYKGECGSSSHHSGGTAAGSHPLSLYLSMLGKPISKKERHYARSHAIFLVRNLDKLRDKLTKHREMVKEGNADFVKGTHFTKKDVLSAHLSALKTSRSVKTRRLTVAEDDIELSKMARMAGVCREIYATITTAKDEEDTTLVTDLYKLPSRKNHPKYYQVVQEPLDLSIINNKILSGDYTTMDMFDKDVNTLINNVELYCGPKSEIGERMRKLRLVYNTAKHSEMDRLNAILTLDGSGDVLHASASGPSSRAETQSEVQAESSEAQVDGGLGEVPSFEAQSSTMSDTESSEIMQVSTPMSVSSESDISEVSDNKVEWMAEEEEEEVIRCICGIYKDEGLMIQCEKCYIWQHTDCMRVKGDEDNYLCDECEPRPIDMEVEITPSTEDEEDVVDDGNRYFMTMMRDDMQIRLASCVYVMKEKQSKRFSYKKSGGLNKDRMDIFKIERLWKNDKGDKFAFGHTYIRPHETFHEPTRKFYTNEVFRTPLYEIFPLHSIVGYCCVLDPLTYCKGRPKDYREDDVYICEYRMDKTLHLFFKIQPKQRAVVNTKSYCFNMFEKRQNPKRTYLPHEVPESYKRSAREKSTSSTEGNDKQQPDQKHTPCNDELAKIETAKRKTKREKVNKIVESLTKGIISPSKKRNDLSYLLADSRKIQF